mmetsp:Transcript_88376/g.205623  ORF Transcript_88376/g.205623 Transcript_88376/m.205623 type:complete len:285 (+) Transcript_88376:55-909(+)
MHGPLLLEIAARAEAEKAPSLHHGSQGLGARLAGEEEAELVEEDHAAAILVDLVEVVPRLHLRALDPAEREAVLELWEAQPPVIAVDLVKDPIDLVEVEYVGQQLLELPLLDEVTSVAGADRLPVGTHQRGFVIEHWVQLHYELVDLSQRDDVVAIVVEAVPEIVERLVALGGGLDLLFEVVEVLDALLCDEVFGCGPGVVRPQVLVALLAGDDVSIKVGRGVRIHAVSDVGAKLHKEHLTPMVAVNPVELLHSLAVGEVQPQAGHARLELAHVNATVSAGVHD